MLVIITRDSIPTINRRKVSPLHLILSYNLMGDIFYCDYPYSPSEMWLNAYFISVLRNTFYLNDFVLFDLTLQYISEHEPNA